MNPERPSNVSKNTNNNQSCAACKFQRRKCTADCPLAPYFPAENQRDFNHAHRLFGVANVLKITKNLDPIQRADAMRSIIYESTVHAMDPVFGCRGVTAHLQSQIARGIAQINSARQQLVQLRMAAHQQQQRQQQQQQYVPMGYDQPMMPLQHPLEGVPMGYDGSIERERASAAMGHPRSAQEDPNHGVLETEQIVKLRMTEQQQQQQQQQQQYVTMGCDPQMMPQHQQQPLEFLKEMGCDQWMMQQQQQQQQQQQYVTMGYDQQMMPQHQQQPLEFLKEMGCDQQMMQQQPPLEGVTMDHPRSAQEDQNHGVLETEP